MNLSLSLAVSTLGIVLLVVAAVVLLLACVGYIGATKRAEAGEEGLARELKQAERALAQAHAQDKGWDRATMEAAARAAAAERFGDAEVGALQLLQVLDRPGTDADQAVFRVETTDGAEHRITLGRTGGVWGAA